MLNGSKHLYEFENFRLDADNPGLWCEGKLISVPPKVLETLILLVERNGEIVSRDELLEKIWKETFVEEGNINYTISQLRKVLGDKKLIQTIPKHGYLFNGKIVAVSINPNAEKPFSIKTETHQISSNNPQNKFYWAVFAAFLIGMLFFTIFAFRLKNEALIKSPNELTSDETRPETVEALHAYTRGRMILDDRDVEKREERAIEEFQRAITLDPTLAVAHAGLAEGLILTARNLSGAQADDLYAKAKISVNKALSLDENLAEAYLARGLLKRNADWYWPGAEQDYVRASELKPNYILAHLRHAHLLSPLGRQSEAIAEINKAYLLDPLSEAVLANQFAVLEAGGEYEEAIKRAEELLNFNPENALYLRALATFLYHRGKYAKVIEMSEKILAKNPKHRPFAWLSLLEASYRKINQLGRSDELLKELELQSATNSDSLYSLAMNYADSNRIDDALTVLEKCFEMHEQRLIWLKVEPRFVNLRMNSRFLDIVQKMKLN
ncbi:MAG: winged helix-turn-helix domain-containing protein [Actinomycetota bacterium]